MKILKVETILLEYSDISKNKLIKEIILPNHKSRRFLDSEIYEQIGGYQLSVNCTLGLRWHLDNGKVINLFDNNTWNSEFAVNESGTLIAVEKYGPRNSKEGRRIVIYDPESIEEHNLDVPFMDYGTSINALTGKREMVKIEMEDKADRKRYEQGETIGSFFNRRKQFTGQILDREQIIITFKKISADDMQKLGLNDFTDCVKVIMMCTGWEEYKILNLRTGVFSESYGYTILEGFYGR